MLRRRADDRDQAIRVERGAVVAGCVVGSGQASAPGRTGADNRLFVNGCLWVFRSGAHWRDLPERYGKWKTVHRRFGASRFESSASAAAVVARRSCPIISGAADVAHNVIWVRYSSSLIPAVADLKPFGIVPAARSGVAEARIAHEADLRIIVGDVAGRTPQVPADRTSPGSDVEPPVFANRINDRASSRLQRCPIW